MGINENYPILDSQSQCAGCQLWLDDQVLTRIGDEVFCSECRPCDMCNGTAEIRAGKPVYPVSHGSGVGLCYWCARESISL